MENKASKLEKESSKWEGSPLVAITAWGIVAVLALTVSGLINYGINSYHIKKEKIPKQNISIYELIKPCYKGRWKENKDKVFDSIESNKFYKEK